MSKIANIIWTPQTYHHFKAAFNYFPHSAEVFKKLSQSEPVVNVQKIQSAKLNIKLCEEMKSSLLHIGDCAEPFQHANQSILSKKVQFLRKCKQILEETKKKPVCLIGRIAGQYAKPRSTQFVNINGIQTHNYKGDNVNSLDENDRNPCEQKLYKGYLNSLQAAKYISQKYPQIFTSHQGLILPFEQSLTRLHSGKYYCQSSHMVWIGERTRQIDGAFVQFFRGIQNPIGVKVSSNAQEKQFVQLVKKLNAKNQMGKLLVIVRMGREKIKNKLQQLIKLKKNEGLNFLFVTDPMHANTFDSKPHKLKTRNTSHILQQIRYFEQKMQQNNLGYGYSLQSTFEDVTECHGLEHPLSQQQIHKNSYTSKCDPRLNRAQTFKLLQNLSKK